MRLIGLCLIVIVVKTYANQTACEGYREFLNVSMVFTSDMDPATLEAFNVTNGKGFIGAKSPRLGFKQCEQMKLTVLKVPNDTILGIYDQKIVDELDVGSKSLGFILGEEIEAVRVFTSFNGRRTVYIVTSPVGMTTERRMENTQVRNGDFRQTLTFVLWPSPTSFVNAVVGNVLLYTAQIKGIKVKVTLLFLAESEDTIRYIDSLRDRLEDKAVDVMPYDLFAITTRMKQNTNTVTYSTEAEYVDTVVRPLRDKMKNHGTHLVLFYVGETLEMKIRVLEFLFSKGAQLERDGVPWIIADMLIMAQKTAREKLSKLAVMKTELLVLEPCLVQDGTSTEELTHCAFHALPEGVAERGLMAGKAFIDAMLGRPEGRSNSFEEVFKQFQTRCSRKSFTSAEERTSEDFLECPESPSIRRVGFPRYDFIRTLKLRPRTAEPKSLSALYLHNDTRGNLPLVLRRLARSKEETQLIHVGDYIVMGERRRDISEYVVLIKDAPFVMQNEGSIYSGMAIDIYNAVRMKLSEVGVILNLKFKEVEVYGSFQDGKWTGVFGELSDKRSGTVLGIGQISITDERLADNTFVFSPVFAHTVVTYIVRKTLESHAFLQFLRPFTFHVWLALLVVFLLSGVHFRLLDAWNPRSEESKLNFREGLWHSYLLITQIGAPFGAVNLPARFYSVIYWFFALVVVGCYTGNLTGFLTQSRMMVPNIFKLVNEKGYKFGMLTNSSVSTTYLNQIFGHSLSGERLIETRLELVNNYEEGVRKVKDEDFILVGTSLVMKTYRNSDEECELSVGKSEYYNQRIQALAFPMRADWPLADAFKQAMSRLKETGELQLIYRKWISSNRKCLLEPKDEDEMQKLGLENFIGLFILTAVGIVFSYICLAFKLGHLKLKEEALKLEAVEQGEEEVIEL